MQLQVRVCEDAGEWDALVERSPHATVFHRWKFLKVMEKHSATEFLGRRYKCRLYPLIGCKNGTPVGIYPIFYYDSRFVKLALSPPLKTGVTYMGPLIAGYESLKQSKKEEYSFGLQKSVDSFLSSELSANLIKVRTPPHCEDVRAFSWNGYSTEPLYNYELDLSKGLACVWEGFDKELRKNIKKTEKADVVVREGTRHELGLLCDSLAARYSEQGVSSDVRRDYLFDAYDCLHPENIKFLVAEKDEAYVTSLLLLAYRGKAHAWLGTIKTTTEGLYPNDLLLWESMRWAHDTGCSTFEIIWANTQRLCRYKSRYDPSSTVYYSCTKVSPHIAFASRLKKRLVYPKGLETK